MQAVIRFEIILVMLLVENSNYDRKDLSITEATNNLKKTKEKQSKVLSIQSVPTQLQHKDSIYRSF